MLTNRSGSLIASFTAMLACSGNSSETTSSIFHPRALASEKIVPKGELPADMNTDAEQTVDVGDMAGSQALQDIKADL